MVRIVVFIFMLSLKVSHIMLWQSTSDDTKLLKRPFRRLALLLPPSMSELQHKLGTLSRDSDHGEGPGFSESAEIMYVVTLLLSLSLPPHPTLSLLFSLEREMCGVSREAPPIRVD